MQYIFNEGLNNREKKINLDTYNHGDEISCHAHEIIDKKFARDLNKKTKNSEGIYIYIIKIDIINVVD